MSSKRDDDNSLVVSQESELSQTEPKPRSDPFTTYEMTTLLEFVEEKKKVVESKKTDFGTTNKKKDAWDWISLNYNKNALVRNRTSIQLKRKWENVKAKAKKEVGSRKRKVKKTGGGPAPKAISQISEKVCTIVPAQMQSLNNEFDCDGVNNNEEEPPIQPKGNISTIDVDNDMGEDLGGTEVLESDNDQDVPRVIKLRKKGGSDAFLRDPRSRLVDWEFEEHRLRLQTLKVTMDVEKERLKQIQRLVLYQKEEHQAKISVLEQKLQNIIPLNVVFENTNEM